MKNTNILVLRSTFGVGSHISTTVHKSLGLNNRKSPLLNTENQTNNIALKLRKYVIGNELKHLNLEFNGFKEITKTYRDYKKTLKLKRVKRTKRKKNKNKTKILE